MRRYRPELSPADWKTWRQWTAWSICIYIMVVAAVMWIGSLVTSSSDTQRSHSASMDQIPLSKQTGLSAREPM
jgi:hypothetical protein